MLAACLNGTIQVDGCDGIERHAFTLPREEILDCDGNETEVAVDMVNHVLPEFMQIARSKGIKKHQCKPTTRKYMYHLRSANLTFSIGILTLPILHSCSISF